MDEKEYWWFSVPDTKKLESPLSERIQKRINEILPSLKSQNIGKNKGKSKESPKKQVIINRL